MTGKEIYEMYLKRVPLIVKFNSNILDCENQFEPDMIAEIVGMKLDNTSECLDVVLSEIDYKKINLSLERNECFNEKDNKYNLKWSEIKERNNNEVIYEPYNEEIEDFVLIEGPYNEVIKQYLSSNTDLNYIDWLQEKIYELNFYKE